MKKYSRVFKFSLNPKIEKDAKCIKKLDDLSEMIRNGSARRGDFSLEIGNALYKHFYGTVVESRVVATNHREMATSTINPIHEPGGGVKKLSAENDLLGDEDEKEECVIDTLKNLALSFE